MPIPTGYSFSRYLAAKKTVDDRSLNRPVWDRLKGELSHHRGPEPLQVLELGAGIGTMVERMLEWELYPGDLHYTLLDTQDANIVEARKRLPVWAQTLGWQVEWGGEVLTFLDGERIVTIDFVLADAFEYVSRKPGTVDLLVAHAFLDLVPLPDSLPGLLNTLQSGGLLYFTLNFDGMTTLEPPIDPVFDARIEALYHADMDARVADGRPSGDSRIGRRLFEYLRKAGAEVLAAGSSDWVVFPTASGYPADEAYFLYFILHFIEETLKAHPDLDADRFADWMSQRWDQIEAGQLVYIAHQVDFLGRRSG